MEADSGRDGGGRGRGCIGADIEMGSACRHCGYDAILMDFVMLVMDGPTATQKI